MYVYPILHTNSIHFHSTTSFSFLYFANNNNINVCCFEQCHFQYSRLNIFVTPAIFFIFGTILTSTFFFFFYFLFFYYFFFYYYFFYLSSCLSSCFSFLFSSTLYFAVCQFLHQHAILIILPIKAS